MLNKMKIALAAGVVAAAAMSSSAASAATQSATASVQILAAVQLNKTADLDFGTVAAGTAAGTVVLDETSATAARTCSGVVCSGTASRARFAVTQATNGAVLNVSFGPGVGAGGVVSLTGPAGSTAMNVTLARSNNTITYSSAAGAANDVFVGGTLSVGANQAAGAYSGTFNVTVDY